jgi:S1-C subfamily serine protease
VRGERFVLQVVVTGVDPGSQAEQEGVAVGDQLISISDRAVVDQDTNAALALLEELQATPEFGRTRR